MTCTRTSWWRSTARTYVSLATAPGASRRSRCSVLRARHYAWEVLHAQHTRRRGSTHGWSISSSSPHHMREPSRQRLSGRAAGHCPGFTRPCMPHFNRRRARSPQWAGDQRWREGVAAQSRARCRMRMLVRRGEATRHTSTVRTARCVAHVGRALPNVPRRPRRRRDATLRMPAHRPLIYPDAGAAGGPCACARAEDMMRVDMGIQVCDGSRMCVVSLGGLPDLAGSVRSSLSVLIALKHD